MLGYPVEVRERLLTHIPISTLNRGVGQGVKSLGPEQTPQFKLGSKAVNAIQCQYPVRNKPFVKTAWIFQIDDPDGMVKDIICGPIWI